MSIARPLEQSHPDSGGASDIALALRRQLATRYRKRIQWELVSAKLAGKRIVDAGVLLRALWLHRKRPSVGRAVLATVLGELRDRELLPEVRQ
jgi:hypothetical protein